MTIHTCDYTSRRLPTDQSKHLFLAFFTYRLHEPIFLRVTAGRTNEGIHHLVLGDSFVSIHSLIVNDEMRGVCSPAEVRLCGDHLFSVIEGNFVD